MLYIYHIIVKCKLSYRILFKDKPCHILQAYDVCMRLKPVIVSILILILFFIIGLFLGRQTAMSGNDGQFDTQNLNTGYYPWGRQENTLKQRLEANGLEVLTSEGTVLHTHQHLDLFLNGRNMPIPADIGINEGENIISPLHTHDGTGIIHVESPTVRKFTLGQFFDVWGVRFADECLGGYCADSEGNTLAVYVNGEKTDTDFRDIELTPHQEIVIAFGLPSQLPNPAPSSYQFPEGY